MWVVLGCLWNDNMNDNIYMEQVHIGHYILGKTIGSGGFAKVKQARHDLTGVRVAIKILNKRKMKNKNMIPKVKREIKILKFITHPNIIKLYEVLDTTNDIFVVMELAERGELFDYLQANQISEDEAKFFFRQLIQGLAYAHSKLIAHRDLKPENILIDADRVVKIVDFGLSNLMKDGRLLKTACGSINYAAPQIVGQQRYEGTSVDIWSCGVILYALLVGKLPFHEETVSLLYRRIEAGSYSIPQSINPLAADLIRRMLQVDPYHRIRIHEIRNHPWIRPYIPIYTRLSTALQPECEYSDSFDGEVFEQIKTFTYSTPNTKDDTSMRKAIRKRQDDSFVVAYQLLAYTKKNKKAASDLVKAVSTSTPHNLLLSQVENIVIEPTFKPREFQFGRRFSGTIKQLIYFVLHSMGKMLIKHIVKNKQYCLKCLYDPYCTVNAEEGHRSAYMQMEGMEVEQQGHEAEEYEKEEQLERQKQRVQKFSKREVRFNLQIYSCSIGEHMIDLQLTQGHPLVFFRMAKALYNMIQKLLHY